MSRAKITDVSSENEVTESIENEVSKLDENEVSETVEKEPVKENIEKVEAKKTVKNEKRISVVRFLENKSQEPYVTILMKKKYGLEFHTQTEWDSLLNKLVNKEIK